MRNEILRLRALREYALDAVNELEKLCGEGNYPAAAGHGTGALKVIANDARYWLEEVAREEQIARTG